MTPLIIHEVTLSAASRSMIFFFLAHPSPEQLLAALEHAEGAYMDQPEFVKLAARVRKNEYGSVPRVAWANSAATI